MTNLERIINKGMATDNWFVDGTGMDAANVVIALRGDDAISYKNNPDWLFEDYKVEIPLKQIEYDLIKKVVACRRIGGDPKLVKALVIEPLLNMGHFQGIKNVGMELSDILNNCKIVPDDYDFGGEKND